MSPRTPQQFKEIREEKKSLIMDAAIILFARDGYHATSISNIARHAGIAKGLMYIYFQSKEELLSSIIEKTVSEINQYFDINKDGYLSEDEFDFFIRQIARVLNEKQTFFRLFFQVLMQNEVRTHFLNSFLGTESLFKSAKDLKEGSFISGIMNMLTDYFTRKKTRSAPEYDPYLDLNLFIITLKGFAITYIYMEEENDGYFNKTIDHIIAQFK
ncbi:MAG: helix-turn-helix domain-containing protein [Bacteroidota bacterium]